MADLVHELILKSADRFPDAEALVYGRSRISYSVLAQEVRSIEQSMLALGLDRGERAGVYLEKRPETVIALFGAAAAGGVFVPINPLLKPEQVAYILRDCNVRILVTSAERLRLLAPVLPQCHDLRTVIVVSPAEALPVVANLNVISWKDALSQAEEFGVHRRIDGDMAAILYTSGSTGKPKGVVLSHRNLTAGAASVAQYLKNNPEDRILSVLPLSFDYGLNQLTTAFRVGAAGILMNYLLPRDILNVLEEEKITGLAAVPPLWIQLAQLKWPSAIPLRYITNSGGAMPRATLDLLRSNLPDTAVFLMYGLTEAFRSTFLPPEQVEIRPDSIGKAIPNAEVLVVREDGSPCAAGEPGELVHRGVLVSMGYWNDHEKTAERFKPVLSHELGLTIPELAVWSGDTVRMDEEGFLYFIGRRDEMIKTSGYRVSPMEVEEVIYATELVAEAAAIGVPHPVLGQAIIVIAVPRAGTSLDQEVLLAACKLHLPAFMLPSRIEFRQGNLPRNPNGKIDRKLLGQELQNAFREPAHE
ncbi:acyl-CoA ligase (AMP-forming), exosortase A system-associated [Nitrosovibrio tenuis]|uniref:Acyl-CoA ligase (AMP-forming), exosortase A-associated n=1 Tax=Nitrosovibrio tenuis TaxID=1233 RepID=A0A1H7LB80_9PROT|nr:acyl-CoA ligase (AMP-forming), exosortase A system-associated [Nitrosovibrio tenuis]SEK96232.1 acyl-CoA ligase (AMP-forming), exosortase A-associated [Nitrosovibrio tenuis]